MENDPKAEAYINNLQDLLQITLKENEIQSVQIFQQQRDSLKNLLWLSTILIAAEVTLFKADLDGLNWCANFGCLFWSTIAILLVIIAFGTCLIIYGRSRSYKIPIHTTNMMEYVIDIFHERKARYFFLEETLSNLNNSISHHANQNILMGKSLSQARWMLISSFIATLICYLVHLAHKI